jgi:hypothetical protein
MPLMLWGHCERLQLQGVPLKAVTLQKLRTPNPQWKKYLRHHGVPVKSLVPTADPAASC